ncbi:MAG: hypothetical protein U5O39_06750 [Gammaproteobacteria bacterium]|nr:hypothetical protein [Gammaproteobacteria bacterium]
MPYPLRFLFATNPGVMSQVLTIIHRVIATFLIHRAGMTVKSSGRSGVPAALNMNPYFHMFYIKRSRRRN